MMISLFTKCVIKTKTFTVDKKKKKKIQCVKSVQKNFIRTIFDMRMLLKMNSFIFCNSFSECR